MYSITNNSSIRLLYCNKAGEEFGVLSPLKDHQRSPVDRGPRNRGTAGRGTVLS